MASIEWATRVLHKSCQERILTVVTAPSSMGSNYRQKKDFVQIDTLK